MTEVGHEYLAEWDPFMDFGTAMETAGYRMSDCEKCGADPSGTQRYKPKKPGPHLVVEFLGDTYNVTINFFSVGGVSSNAENVNKPGENLNDPDRDTEASFWKGRVSRYQK